MAGEAAADRQASRATDGARTATAGEPAFIAVDWGTSSFRAYLATAGGDCVDAVQSHQGILAITDCRFEAALIRALAPWLPARAALPIIMCGMIGSRQGWADVPYRACPARLADLAAGVMRVAVTGTSGAHIVPGLSVSADGRSPDVMRGEETQIAGAMARLGIDGGLFVLPGTHSKWASVEAGAIRSFRTYMTGEVFGALKGHTILGRLMADAPAAGDGFARGLAAAESAGGGPGALLNLVFSARTRGLFSEIAAGDIADYLSGLLIGAEVRDAARRGDRVTIIATDALAGRYQEACRTFGIEAEAAPADCAVAGLAAIAREAGWITA